MKDEFDNFCFIMNKLQQVAVDHRRPVRKLFRKMSQLAEKVCDGDLILESFREICDPKNLLVC